MKTRTKWVIVHQGRKGNRYFYRQHWSREEAMINMARFRHHGTRILYMVIVHW